MGASLARRFVEMCGSCFNIVDSVGFSLRSHDVPVSLCRTAVLQRSSSFRPVSEHHAVGCWWCAQLVNDECAGSYHYSDGSLNKPPTISSTDLSLDPPRSMQGSHFTASTAEKSWRALLTVLPRYGTFHRKTKQELGLSQTREDNMGGSLSDKRDPFAQHADSLRRPHSLRYLCSKVGPYLLLERCTLCFSASRCDPVAPAACTQIVSFIALTANNGITALD